MDDPRDRRRDGDPVLRGRIPARLDNYYARMYFHAIGIGLAALATYLVMHAFELQKYEPALDFPIAYRAFIFDSQCDSQRAFARVVGMRRYL